MRHLLPLTWIGHIPSSHGLLGNRDAPFSNQIFHVAEAQAQLSSVILANTSGTSATVGFAAIASAQFEVPASAQDGVWPSPVTDAGMFPDQAT